ncbi:MAG: ribonuclease III [Myxococcota bacterium]
MAPPPPKLNPRPSAASGMSSGSVVALVAALGHQFKDPVLLAEALTHPSYAFENPREAPRHNQRLEFLGDAVLELIIRDRLLRAHPAAGEGVLSKMRNAIVNEAMLAETAVRLGVANALRLGAGEEKTGGRQKPRILADAVEAILGAIFLDGGLSAADAAVGRWFEDALSAAGDRPGRRDYKTELQELVQRHLKQVPSYRIAADRGDGREDRFVVELLVQDKVITSSEGRNKKEATQRAAAAALSILEAQWANGGPGNAT